MQAKKNKYEVKGKHFMIPAYENYTPHYLNAFVIGQFKQQEPREGFSSLVTIPKKYI